ncbi:C4-dicarboxylate ABC transporter permease [Gallibacterium anatis]|uniref:TRAP transporter permease n=1 Tax=Gallibacterium anatis TaxID=750 RepID=UPI000530CFD1|nr:TRAP transporter permease [Gallibacterium anatis]KGQ43514.1 C4-dicarboxylate ABC transporter permease [Gallibacterium anatis]KGQ49102.1 C4-dicarboxylate ABC transporter permease [Gallibacterium anatis]KGQ49909.1 C4-dicarboxylate ABC transporter permease [Gallibacterium anatis 10672-6]KGQ56777.1 C4-dicarboxylate ABC transporter permease [Gallibacterium anatis str. Avicor]KGQ60469.1 C4-dicarboxylate ABC transporter permease [Gallibacterium anatis]
MSNQQVKPASDYQEILEKYDKESVVKTGQSQWQKHIITIVAVAYSLFHLYITFYPMPTLLQRALHVGIGALLIFLVYPAAKKYSKRGIMWFDWILGILALITAGYLCYEYDALMTTRGGIPNENDIIFAIITTLIVIEAARRLTGYILIIFSLLFLLYPFISSMDFMPDRLLTRYYDIGDIFGQLYLKTEGLYSSAIGASVSFIFLFILFGAFLAKSGMGKLFNDLALALAGSRQGGPAKVAVISSGFMGSINGAAVANVVSTGAFTIPLMKKIGYHPNFAGAVEASASVGGQILPPIMGASAFIMAETTGVKYSTIALAALLPALLYYISVIAQVHFRAGKRNLKGLSKDQLPQLKLVMKERGHMFIPIIALVAFLIESVPVGYAASYTILITIVVSWLRKETRMGLKEIIEALEDGAKQSLPVMAACAVVGIIIGVVNLTSFGTVMTSYIVTFGAGSLLLTLILTMLASIVLGMGLPSIPAYIITATMAAPALADFNIPLLVSHMFVFYFGIFANITPPVALASFAGAGIAGGDPMRTGWQSLKLALAGFIIPFIFVYNPNMLMIDINNAVITANSFPLPAVTEIISVCVTSILGVIGLSAAIEGYFKHSINNIFRIILAVGSVLLISPEFISDIIGITILAIILIINLKQAKMVG